MPYSTTKQKIACRNFVTATQTFFKHVTDTAKINFVQMTLKQKVEIKSLDERTLYITLMTP